MADLAIAGVAIGVFSVFFVSFIVEESPEQSTIEKLLMDCKLHFMNFLQFLYVSALSEAFMSFVNESTDCPSLNTSLFTVSVNSIIAGFSDVNNSIAVDCAAGNSMADFSSVIVLIFIGEDSVLCFVLLIVGVDVTSPVIFSNADEVSEIFFLRF